MTGTGRPRFGRQGGRSLLEFIAGGVIVAILTGVLLQRLHLYRAQAERAAVEQTVGIVRTALAAKSARLLAQGKAHELEALARQNPMEWLERAPHQYAGEFFAPAPGAVPPGHWYFDRKQHLLVYLLNSGGIFPHGTSIAQKYKVELLRRNNDFNRPTEVPVGITLIRVAG